MGKTFMINNNNNNAMNNGMNNNSANNNGMNNNGMNNGTPNGIWDTIKQYKSKWVVESTRRFTDVELNALERAEVKAGPHGLSVCFFMKNSGEYRFISIDSQSPLEIGDCPNPKDLVLKTLKNIADPNVPLGTVTLRVDYQPEQRTDEATNFDNPFGL